MKNNSCYKFNLSLLEEAIKAYDSAFLGENLDMEQVRCSLEALAEEFKISIIHILLNVYKYTDEDILHSRPWHDTKSWSETMDVSESIKLVNLGLFDCLDVLVKLSRKLKNKDTEVSLEIIDVIYKTCLLCMLNGFRESAEWHLYIQGLESEMRAYKEKVEAPQKASQKAHDGRYKERRELLEKMASVARELWENGSTLLHHQMKDYLLNNYADEAGQLPFVSLTERTVLKNLKDVAKELGRPDLISGQKKSLK